MDSSAALRSFQYTVSLARILHEKPATAYLPNGNWRTLKISHVSGLVAGGKPNSSPKKQYVTLISCLKTPESTVTSNSNGPLEKKTLQTATFPRLEELMLEVCDETEIAGLKMKIGDIEMHLKRNVGAKKAPLASVLPMTALPISPSVAAAVAPSAPPPNSSPEKTTPFTNVSFGKSSKLAALEASETNNFVLWYLLQRYVLLTDVGSFINGRTVKGKTLPPMCKEGSVIKEGQVIGYLDQFGTHFPVRADVAGEVLKLLVDDGDAIGYGDPLVAVLPSFHGIK